MDDIKTLADIFGYKKFPYSLKPADASEVFFRANTPQVTKHRMPLEEQLIGIEVEVEKAKFNFVNELIPMSFWNPTEDGSLRNSGVEFVSCPMPAKYAEQMLHILFARLPPGYEFSLRTSIHVHFNVRDFTPEQLKSLIFIYLTVEKLLYKWIGMNRSKSIFCVPVQDTTLTHRINMFFDQPGYIKALSWMKYTGFNLLPIKDKGTVEFRHLFGTDKLDLILDWIGIIQKMFQYSLAHPHEFISKHVLELNTNSEYRMFVEGVFQEYAHHIIYQGFEKDVEAGVSYIKGNAYSNPFFTELQGKATKTCKLYKSFKVHAPPAPSKSVKWTYPSVQVAPQTPTQNPVIYSGQFADMQTSVLTPPPFPEQPAEKNYSNALDVQWDTTVQAWKVIEGYFIELPDKKVYRIYPSYSGQTRLYWKDYMPPIFPEKVRSGDPHTKYYAPPPDPMSDMTMLWDKCKANWSIHYQAWKEEQTGIYYVDRNSTGLIRVVSPSTGLLEGDESSAE